MSNPNHMHEFDPNCRGLCKTHVSGQMCHQPEEALIHERYREHVKREEERQAGELQNETQRLIDLVRHQREDLHTAGLITDEEYASLAEDHAAVARLEGYDQTREQCRKEFSKECERFHNEGRKCSTCGRADVDKLREAFERAAIYRHFRNSDPRAEHYETFEDCQHTDCFEARQILGIKSEVV